MFWPVYGSTDREYLTGFQKRNILKKEARRKNAKERERLEKLELRRQAGILPVVRRVLVLDAGFRCSIGESWQSARHRM